jgi:uncharacterized membrane protein YeaQ/YmgE (transglycosylase-associated protein family)
MAPCVPKLWPFPCSLELKLKLKLNRSERRVCELSRLDRVGAIVGVIAKLMMPGKDPGGFIITVLLGIAGALMGGFLGRALGFYREGEPAGYIMSVVGAVILLFLYRRVRRESGVRCAGRRASAQKVIGRRTSAIQRSDARGRFVIVCEEVKTCQ